MFLCYHLFLCQYVTDMRTVQKKLVELEESMVFIHKEEALFKMELSSYPELEILKESIEPYQKFFGLVLRWQRTEKRCVWLR